MRRPLYVSIDTRDESDHHLHHRGAMVRSHSNYGQNHNTVNNTGANNLNDMISKEVDDVKSLVTDLLYSKTFWRFCVFTLFLINLKTIFRHVDATLPTYLLRCFGSKYPKGMIYSINPFMIIWLTPIVAALTSTWPHYDMIKWGGYLSALSPFFVACSTSTWVVVMFMITLSLGESIWSPRVYDYTMSIAPEGKEATFSALASAPLFAAKIPVGLLSGYLVAKYLPESDSTDAQEVEYGDAHARKNGRTVWLIIGLVILTSPLLITLCEKCIREPEKVKEKKNQRRSISNSGSNTDNNEIIVKRSANNHNKFVILQDNDDYEDSVTL